MKKKILIALGVVLLAGGYEGYTMATAKKPPKLRINGTIYILPKSFTLNLAGGQYATLTVALLLGPTQSQGTTNPSNPPPTGFGSLPEEAVVRAIITNDLTNQPADTLLSNPGRAGLERKILADIGSQTDDKITAVYFTDLAIQ